jgi:DNA-binding transcriptional ArsR family regulator
VPIGWACAGGAEYVIYNRMVVGLLTPQALSDVEIDRIFRALSDSTRRDILARAIEREQSVSALARHYEISLTAVQKHVAVLERAALVSKHRTGREQRVAAERNTLRRAAALLEQYEQLWIQRATKIAEILAEADEEKGEAS